MARVDGNNARHRLLPPLNNHREAFVLAWRPEGKSSTRWENLGVVELFSEAEIEAGGP